MNEARTISRWPQPFLLLLVSCCLFFTRLDTALLEPEEARYAEISRQMFAAGEWVVPLYHGQPYYDKPPLLYWLAMASYSIFGVHDWAARLVPGFCGILSILIVYGWGRSAFGARAGFLSALVLALTARFIYLGRFVATDAPFSLCVVGALACTHLALIGPNLRWRWWMPAAAACGIGLLAKGPTVFVLVGVPTAVYLFIDKAAVRPPVRAYLAYLTVAVLIAVPWYLAVMRRDPTFAEYFFWKHHVLRYVSPFDHPKPFWFYLPDLMAGTLPWSLLLAPIAAQMWRDRQLLLRRRASASAFPFLSAIWCVAFFSASGCKRVGYILPAFAPLALAFGVYLDRWLSERRQALAPSSLAAALPLTVVLFGMAATVGLAAFQYCSIALTIALALGLAAVAVVLILLRRRLTPTAGLVICSILMASQCVAGVQWVLPAYADRFSLRREVLQAQSEMPMSARVVCFPRRADSITFYLQRDDIVVFNEQQGDEAIAYLQENPNAWLFLRDSEASRRLLADLPPMVTADERGKQQSTSVFRIRRLDATALAPGPR